MWSSSVELFSFRFFGFLSLVVLVVVGFFGVAVVLLQNVEKLCFGNTLNGMGSVLHVVGGTKQDTLEDTI